MQAFICVLPAEDRFLTTANADFRKKPAARQQKCHLLGNARSILRKQPALGIALEAHARPSPSAVVGKPCMLHRVRTMVRDAVIPDVLPGIRSPLEEDRHKLARVGLGVAPTSDFWTYGGEDHFRRIGI